MQIASRIAGLTIVALIAAGGIMQAGAATLAQFNLDAMSDGVVSDISGNNHDATFTGSPTLSADNPFPGVTFGVPDKSVDVSVGSTYALLANPGTINLSQNGDQFTIECWFKPTAMQYMTLVGLGLTGDPIVGSNYQRLDINADGLVQGAFYGFSGGWHVVLSTNAIPLNTWTHLAYVYNVAGDYAMHMYLNGVEAATPTYVGYNMITGGWAEVAIGVGGNGQARGLIDDVRISNKALAPSQLGFHKSFTPPPHGTIITVK